MKTKKLTSGTVGIRIGRRKKMSMCAYFLDGWIQKALKEACGERYVETMTDEELLHAFLQEDMSEAEYTLFNMMLGGGDDLYKREIYLETIEGYRKWLQRSRQIDRIIN
jgi:hypothetical protein